MKIALKYALWRSVPRFVGAQTAKHPEHDADFLQVVHGSIEVLPWKTASVNDNAAHFIVCRPSCCHIFTYPKCAGATVL
jgi:hypothetical protein